MSARPMDNPTPILLQDQDLNSASSASSDGVAGGSTSGVKPWERTKLHQTLQTYKKLSPGVTEVGSTNASQDNLAAGGSKDRLAVVRKRLMRDLWKEGDESSGDDEDDAEEDEMEKEVEMLDADEVFGLIRSVTDPEHENLTLEQLMVVSRDQCHVRNTPGKEAVYIEFTPTIPHCSMATLIGLTLRVRLMRALSPRYRIDIRIKKGTHQSENAINKQLNDKERCIAAGENNHLLGVVEGCLQTAHKRGKA